MRGHRFKAWDKTHNEWYMDGNVFHLEYSGKYGDFYFDNDHPSNMRDVELIWVESTGLHDRHGKEIWEGDRVTAHYFYFDGNFDADGYITGEIRITPNGILICSDTEDRFIYETSHHDEPCLEVIGTIYGEGE